MALLNQILATNPLLQSISVECSFPQHAPASGASFIEHLKGLKDLKALAIAAHDCLDAVSLGALLEALPHLHSLESQVLERVKLSPDAADRFTGVGSGLQEFIVDQCWADDAVTPRMLTTLYQTSISRIQWQPD